MSEGQDNTQNHSENYLQDDLPANHNPLIGTLHRDTLCNVRDALCTLRELSEVRDLSATEHTMTGFHFLMTCIINALNFELEQRE